MFRYNREEWMKTKLILLIIFLSGKICLAGDFKNHPDYDLIIQEAELGDMMVTSGKIFLSSENVYVDSLSERASIVRATQKEIIDEKGFYSNYTNLKEYEILFIFENEKIRMHEKAIKYNPITKKDFFHCWESVYDGEIPLPVEPIICFLPFFNSETESRSRCVGITKIA